MTRKYDENGHYRHAPTTPLPEKIEADTALGIDFQYMDLPVQYTVLTSAPVSIRDTQKKWAATNQDWSKYRRIVLRVDNTCNQPVKLFINRQGVGDFMRLDGTRSEVTIPANASAVVVTPTDWPILGETIAENLALGIQADVAPTAGNVTVAGYFDPLR